VLMTAVQWLPFVAYVAYRGNTFEDHLSLRPHIQSAPAFFIPYVYEGLNSTVTATQPPVNIGNCWSLGWLAPALLIFFVASFRAAISRHQAFALFLSASPVVLWAFGIPPFSLVSKLPFFNRLGVHYGTVMAAFVVAPLIGFGYQLLARRPSKLNGTMIATGT